MFPFIAERVVDEKVVVESCQCTIEKLTTKEE